MLRPAESLYRLQELDVELAELRSKLREASSLLGETAELKEARHLAELARADVTRATGKLREAEYDLERIGEKLTAAEARLYDGTVINPKELNSLQQDHAQLQRARSRIEDQVLAAMTEIEHGEANVGTTAARLSSVASAWQSVQDRASEEVSRLQKRVGVLTRERDEVIASVSEAALSVYLEVQRKKGGRAVALLVGQMCQGCRVTLPTGKAQAARLSSELVLCPNCGRILLPKNL
ncbi:MAG TPA: hypothetical protein DCY27_08930 [Desulfobacterales bacterium]|nr:hypothetical protein [Desulfobacterales bacterium]